MNGVDVFKPQTGEVVSKNSDGIACWCIDADYNEESFFVRHAYFLGANDLGDEVMRDTGATTRKVSGRAEVAQGQAKTSLRFSPWQ